MKKPTVLLYACSALLSFAVSFLLDPDEPAPRKKAVLSAERPGIQSPEAEALARRTPSGRK